MPGQLMDEFFFAATSTGRKNDSNLRWETMGFPRDRQLQKINGDG